MELRIATHNDVQRIADYLMRWVDEMNYTVVDSELKDDIKRSIDTGVTFFLEDADQVLGIMTGYSIYHFWTQRFSAHEHWFFVSPEHRKMGVGDILLRAFEAWAKHKNCDSVIINCNAFGSVDPKKIVSHLEKMGYNTHGYQMRRVL